MGLFWAFNRRFVFLGACATLFSLTARADQHTNGILPHAGILMQKPVSNVDLKFLPHYSNKSWNADLPSMEAANKTGAEMCRGLLDESKYKLLLFGFSGLWLNREDVETAFPASLSKATHKMLDQLIHCESVTVEAHYTTVAGQRRAIDSNSAGLIILGMLAGEMKEPKFGRFGAYASLQSTCKPRPDEDRVLLSRHAACLLNSASIDDEKKNLEKALKKKWNDIAETARKNIAALEKNRPAGCDQVKLDIEARKIPVTRFTPFQSISCVKDEEIPTHDKN